MKPNDLFNTPGTSWAPVCTRCQRRRRHGQLNIEGTIHHGGTVQCIDRKDCERAVRKLKRKAS